MGKSIWVLEFQRLPAFYVFAFELVDERTEVGWQQTFVEVGRAMEDDVGEGLLVSLVGLDVFELHVLQLLNHPLPIGLRLLEDFATDLLFLGGEVFEHEEVIASEQPTESDEYGQGGDD